jgi:signal transduction histidine kinase
MLQVLSHLVENAIRYTPAECKVVIRTGVERAEGRTWATVTVADTGFGMREEELPHLFERFFRGEKPMTLHIPGTGLGLSVAKDIVDTHAGRLTVESKEEQGTSFTVWLPYVEAEA